MIVIIILVICVCVCVCAILCDEMGRVEPSCGLIPNGTCFPIKISMVLPRGATSDKFQVFVIWCMDGSIHVCVCMYCLQVYLLGIGGVCLYSCLYSCFGVILNCCEGPLPVSGDCQRDIGA